MVLTSRPCLVPVTLLSVAGVFAAPTEPVVDGDHFRYLDREELGPFPQDIDPKLSSGGAQFRSKLTAVLRRAVSAPSDNSDSGSLSTGIIVLISFASVFGAVVVLGCASLLLTRRARRSAKFHSNSTSKFLESSSPATTIGASMLSGSTVVSPSGTVDGRTLMQVLADAGLPVPRHPLSDRKQHVVISAEKPSSPIRALLRSPFGSRVSNSSRSSASSRVLVIDQNSASAAEAICVGEKSRVPPVPAVPRLVSCSMADDVKHDGDLADRVPHTTSSAVTSLPYAPSRQQTMQSIDSNMSDDSIPPCPPASPSTDLLAFGLPPTQPTAPCSSTEPTSVASTTPATATTTSPRVLRVVNPKPKTTRANSNPLARSVVQRNMLHLAHSSRTHSGAEPAQHPFAASAIVSNQAAIHTPRSETLLRPPALRVNTTGLPVQGL